MKFFFYGTLCDVGLRRVVLGRDVAGETAVLPGHAVHWSQAGPFAVLVARAAA